ncbi:AAA-domain-containing protein [Polyplosphaeria fusca]|uniref:AAA-domain-containing protein n=1 Tax=Polyplosphaeria fusca TaxID=682080 RepID=A0A9P4QPS8_9PLEO|nr:AAA-domain-containing protein [Polyplosphaeria fusca]
MMRGNHSTAMQKTYDECYLTCSTAVYFESQNNEAEALRSWKDALDQIYYHNAYRVPTHYRPKSETERALHESLRQLELQCKERVHLLEALRQSRDEAKEAGDAKHAPAPPPHLSGPSPSETNEPGWLGGGTIRPVDYSDICRPPLPQRPGLQARKSSGPESGRSNSMTNAVNGPLLSPSHKKESRTPSPEKKGRMLRTLRPGGRDKSRGSSSSMPSSLRAQPPAASKAATLAFSSSTASSSRLPMYLAAHASKESVATTPPVSGRPSMDRPVSRLDSESQPGQGAGQDGHSTQAPFHFRTGDAPANAYSVPSSEARNDESPFVPRIARKEVPTPSSQRSSLDLGKTRSNTGIGAALLPYRNEYAVPTPAMAPSPNSARSRQPKKSAAREMVPLEVDNMSEQKNFPTRRRAKAKEATARADLPLTPGADVGDATESENESDEWKGRVKHILKSLPRGVDQQAAQQILNEIVIQGDEVRWDDVAGLDVAKSALKETVVYPFLRPDLFMGLREPARGMLLFGPPGTGKTMLARAVATESRSTFFAISASSLTSKFLGESEKLVRALFALAKMLAPSIIFVDEIDSLLSSRAGSGEHEATRRIKTEFLIQWSDLAKAAAGRELSEKDKEKGDASRVLVLAATNLPWAIDEAARRRFVRRQYIPLPEEHVRRTQLNTLLSHQKQNISPTEMDRLVEMTEGFSGSDITALAKDAAMGPLRSLGERLLHMTMDEIRPIRMGDFVASLQTIRPSVGKQGLKEYEDWAREFGERGG